MSDSESLVGQLKTRRVIRGAIAHVVIAWLFVQIADVVFPYLGGGDESVRWVLVISVATFPVTLFIAWLSDQPWSGSGHPVPEAVVLVLIALAAGWWVQGNLPDTARERTSIVVMPLEHADDPVAVTLSRALSEEISSLLMKSRSIDVIGHESARSDALAGLGTTGIAQRLNVSNVFEGSVAARGDSMQIELRLLSAAGEILWESAIEDSIANMFAVQERIASAIEARLGAGDDAVPVAQVAAERCWMPVDADALRQYYTARYYIEARADSAESGEQIAEAIGLYESLLEQHPGFSEARSGLAFALRYQWYFDRDNALPESEVGPRMRELAERAHDDCPTNGEALNILPNQYDHPNGWISMYQQLVAFAELEPHRAEHRERLTGHFNMTGLVDKAFETAQRNLALNPLSVKAIVNLAGIEQYYGDLDRSIELWDQAFELGYAGPHWGRAMKTMNECGTDYVCLNERGVLFPPSLVDELDTLLLITREPANDEDLRESIDAAIALHDSDPENMVNSLNLMACRSRHLTPMFFELWEAHKQHHGTGRFNWYRPNVWMGECSDVWSDPRFPDYVRDEGLDEYWRTVGWPEFCQPRGDDFVCGRNLNGS
jgi:TolB-like protein